jgi:hypothetical protein
MPLGGITFASLFFMTYRFDEVGENLISPTPAEGI